MTAWWHLTKESFLILRRDKIFLPIIIAGFLIILFANFASEWSLEEFEKVLFDVGIAGIRFTGAIVAILWGVRVMTDPLQDRSIELRVAAPSPRFVWVLARFTGLAACLMFMGLSFAIIWQTIMYLHNFGLMSNLQSWTLGMLLMEWLVLGALGLLVGSMSGFSTAMFVTFVAWIIGLIAPIVAATSDPSASEFQKSIVEFIGKSWNFQRFNLVDQLEAGARTIDLADVIPRIAWGSSVLMGCLVLACWVFQERDL